MHGNNYHPSFAITQINGEPRIRDLDLAVRLGFERRRSIRNLIKANLKKLNEFSVCYTVERTSGEQGGRPATEYYLDRKQAIFICMKSETDNAFEVQAEIVRVFDAYLNGAPPQPAFNIPQTLPEALRLAADLAEANAQQQARLAVAEPKAEALDKIATVYREDGSEKITEQVRVTAKGLARLAVNLRPLNGGSV